MWLEFTVPDDKRLKLATALVRDHHVRDEALACITLSSGRWHIPDSAPDVARDIRQIMAAHGVVAVTATRPGRHAAQALAGAAEQFAVALRVFANSLED